MASIVARCNAARKRSCASIQPLRCGFVDTGAQHALDFAPLVVRQIREDFFGRAPIAGIVGIDGARKRAAGIVFAAKDRFCSSEERMFQTLSFRTKCCDPTMPAKSQKWGADCPNA
jgi:hypothetical protein